MQSVKIMWFNFLHLNLLLFAASMLNVTFVLLLGFFFGITSGPVTFTNAIVFYSTLGFSGYLSVYRAPNNPIFYIIPTAILSAFLASVWSSLLNIPYVYFCIFLAPCIIVLGTLANTHKIFQLISAGLIIVSSLFLALSY